MFFSALVLPSTTLYLLCLMQVRSVPLLPISSQHFVLSFFLMSQISNRVFKSKTSGFMEVLHKLRFARARIATLIINKIIIFASVAIYGNNQKVTRLKLIFYGYLGYFKLYYQ